LRYDLAGAFRRLRPEIVVTMNFDLTWGEEGNANHPDHRATGLSVLDASRDAGNRWVFPEAGEPWDRIREVYVFGAERPTHFIDVSETLEAGVTSLRAHRAYLEGLGGDFDPDGFLRGLAGFAGMSAGCEYAVTFRRFVVG
jgi:LmbE family N-acetylglucosaminyl deacetylase